MKVKRRLEVGGLRSWLVTGDWEDPGQVRSGLSLQKYLDNWLGWLCVAGLQASWCWRCRLAAGPGLPRTINTAAALQWTAATATSSQDQPPPPPPLACRVCLVLRLESLRTGISSPSSLPRTANNELQIFCLQKNLFCRLRTAVDDPANCQVRPDIFLLS